MSSIFENNNAPYNYSGYGSAIDDIDDIDEGNSAETTLQTEVYNLILNQVGIDDATMKKIVSLITKNAEATYTFIRINGDFSLIYFKDNFGHLTPIPLKKIIETRDLL